MLTRFVCRSAEARYDPGRMRPGQFDDFTDAADMLEVVVSSQTPVTDVEYDTDYFTKGWREAENRYDLETRRRIEGRGPSVIREALEPATVLDVGCGPGFLMLFLHELGVEVHGVDFAPASLALAPAEVRDRIEIGHVDRLSAPDTSFDVVVCREVIEHLTVLQARRCVSEMCRVSSRYVYVTTRFHPEPRGILDVTTQFEVDPTHITLMLKGLLRTLFVLEGFVRRPALEERLDWAGKNRVLVYERSATVS